MKKSRHLLWILPVMLLAVCVVLLAGCQAVQRQFLFFPTHNSRDTGLTPWEREGRIIGYSRQVAAPQNVWLMLHGNAGQAADRAYAIHCFSPRDSVFVMEYPGYGARDGKPSKDSFDAAAVEAYLCLRKSFPVTPVCVVGESLGTGPSCVLAGQTPPPDKIVLVVPFDNLKSVAADHVPFLPAGLILRGSWDNTRSLSAYRGPVEIFGAQDDTVIPIEHARKLAAAIPSAAFHAIPGGHNDWSRSGRVEIRNP
jgi:pimeloyl-ACP methyl ester carboxylesterase